jgi:hypothetical protein
MQTRPVSTCVVPSRFTQTLKARTVPAVSGLSFWCARNQLTARKGSHRMKLRLLFKILPDVRSAYKRNTTLRVQCLVVLKSP